MEVLVCSLVKLDVESDVNTHKELSKDELPVSAELLLPVWVGPENHH